MLVIRGGSEKGTVVRGRIEEVPIVGGRREQGTVESRGVAEIAQTAWSWEQVTTMRRSIEEEPIVDSRWP